MVWKQCKEQTQNSALTFDPKINRGPPWVCELKYGNIICQKVMELWCRNNAKFKLKIWPWRDLLTPKSISIFPRSCSARKKIYHCMSKGNTELMYGNHFYTDTRADRHGQVYPPPLVTVFNSERLGYFDRLVSFRVTEYHVQKSGARLVYCKLLIVALIWSMLFKINAMRHHFQ